MGSGGRRVAGVRARTWGSSRGEVSVKAGAGSSGGDLGAAAPAVDVAVNVVRWESGRGVVVRFTGGSGAPNAAGSLYFKAPGYAQRVTVRLESGLTTRARTEVVAMRPGGQAARARSCLKSSSPWC